MDNFIIPAKTMEELEERTIRFLKIVEKHNLCFKRSKCDFNIEEIPIIGVIIEKGQIKMEQEKIKTVKEWKVSTKVKDVESFLGFTNFYRQFIQNFSHITKPLNELKGKKDWKWEGEYQKAFEELKEKITSQPVLALSVVATSCQNGTCSMLTSAKLSIGYLVVGIIRELNKEPSLHCYPIYISYRWSMLQQYVCLMSTLQ